MLRNVPHNKKGPKAAGGGAPGEFGHHDNSSQIERPEQAQVQRLISGSHPEGFSCAFCGNFAPWSRMAAFDKNLKFCEVCHDAMDALDTGANDALAILREAAW